MGERSGGANGKPSQKSGVHIESRLAALLDVLPDATYRQLAERFTAIVPYDRLVIGVLTEGGRAVRQLFVTGVPVAGWDSHLTHDVRHSLIEDVLASKKPRFGKAVDPDLQARYPAHSALVADGMRSTLTVPLIVRGTPIGVLFLASRKENAYAEREAALAEDACRFLAVAIENQRLKELDADRARRAEALVEIGRIISGATQVEAAFPECAEKVRALVPMDRMTVAIADRAHGTYSDVYWTGVSVESWEPGVQLPLAGTNTALVLEGGDPLVFNATSSEELGRLYPQFAGSAGSGLASAISVPLRHGGQVIGALHLRSRLPNAYRAEDVATVQAVADQIAGAVHDDLLIAQVQRDAEERRVLTEIGRIVSSTLEIEDIYPRFAEQVAKLVPFDRIVIALFNENHQRVSLDAYMAGTQVPGYPRGAKFPVAGTSFEELIRSKSSVVINGDEMRRLAATGGSSVPALSVGLQSMLMTPLIWQDRVIGALNLRSKMHNPYTPAVVALAEQVSAQIAGAVTTSRLYGQAKQDALARATIAEFGRTVNSDLSLDRTCQAVAEALGRLMKFDRLVISLAMAGGGSFGIAYVTGVPVNGDELRTTPVPALRAQFGLEREDGAVLLGDLPPELVERHPGFLSAGLRSWMEVPVGPIGGPLAYVSLRSRQQDAYTEQDLALLKEIALQIAPAFRNATLLKELEKRVADRTADLNASDAAKTRMMATVSHEISNALAAIAGFNQVLLKNRTGNLTKRQLLVLHSIESSTGQLASLTRDLTDFANIEAGQYRLDKEQVDLAGLVSDVAASLAPGFTKKQQRFVVSGCDRPLELQADPHRVAQVLRNLISNASKYSAKGTGITVSLEISEGTARIAVRDQGIGISEEDQKLLFQSFFRANHPEVRAVSGTGLGLAVSKRLLELHEGGIGVASTLGRGSVFTMWLPLGRVTPAAPAP